VVADPEAAQRASELEQCQLPQCCPVVPILAMVLVLDLELLEAVEGGRLQPAVVELAVVVRTLELEAAAAGASVGREDAGHDAIVVVVVCAREIEVERGGAPDVAPPGGEDLDADGVGDGEAGDDLAEDAVREDADQVLAAIHGFHFHRDLVAVSVQLLLRAAAKAHGPTRLRRQRP